MASGICIKCKGGLDLNPRLRIRRVVIYCFCNNCWNVFGLIVCLLVGFCWLDWLLGCLLVVVGAFWLLLAYLLAVGLLVGCCYLDWLLPFLLIVGCCLSCLLVGLVVSCWFCCLLAVSWVVCCLLVSCCLGCWVACLRVDC